MRLDLICGTDDLRPIFNYVKVDAKECVCTDAHVLAVIPTENIFSKDFIKTLGERTILIHSIDWKQLKPKQLIYWESENMIGIEPLNNKRPIFIKVETQENVGKYPNWEAVVPSLNDSYKISPINAIGVNTELLAKLQKALGFVASKLVFYAENRAIMVYDGKTTDSARDIVTTGSYGLVMPTKLS